MQEGYERWELPFYNLIIDKPNAMLFLSSKNPDFSGTPAVTSASFKKAAGGKNVTRWGSNLVIVVNEFSFLELSSINQIDRAINTADTYNGGGSENETYSKNFKLLRFNCLG